MPSDMVKMSGLYVKEGWMERGEQVGGQREKEQREG